MNKKVILFWMIIICCASLRVIFSMYDSVPDIGECLKKEVTGIGIINENPSLTETGQILIVDVGKMYIQNGGEISTGQASYDLKSSCLQDGLEITLRLKTKFYPHYNYGDQISFLGKLSEPFNFKSSTGRVFNYKGYLAKDDIFYEIKSANVNVVTTNLGNTVTTLLYKIKKTFVNNLNIVLGEPHSALAAGLVVGEKSALGKDLLNDFRTVGLIHIVVLSGFNITIVADTLRKLLSRLPRIWGMVIGGIGIILFGILVGGGATVVRSCFMASVALSANLIRRDYDVFRALIFAGCIMLIQNPNILLHDPSFQLSFMATLGLILLAKQLEKFFWFIPEKFEMRGIFTATFSTQIFVSPFILYMMGQISIIGVVANILVLPFIPITMLVVFLAGSVGFVPGIVFSVASQFFGWCAHLLLTYELFIVEYFARIPFVSLTFPQFSGWWVVGFYVVFFGIYGFFIIKKNKNI